MKFDVINKSFCLYKLDENREIPREIYQSCFFNVTKTNNELSIICEADINLSCGTIEKDLRLIKVFDCKGFKTRGVICCIAETLTKNNISFSIISSYESNHVLVSSDVIDETIKALLENGFVFFKE